MITIFIDSTEFKADKSRLGKPFGHLSQLTLFDYVQIHTSEINVREIESSITDTVRKTCDSAIDGITRVSSYLSNDPFNEKLDNYKKNHEKIFEEASHAAVNKFNNWLTENKVIVHTINAEDSASVINAYFKGLEPFKSLKNRDDFPDAFLWQSLVRLNNNNHENLYFVSSDNNLRNKVHLHLENFIPICSLKDLFELNEIQKLVIELDKFKKKANSDALIELIRLELNVQSDELANEANRLIQRDLIGTIFVDNTDNLRGTITEINAIDDLQLITDYIQIANYPSAYLYVDAEFQITVAKSYSLAEASYGIKNYNFDRVIGLTENSTDTHEIGENYILLNLHAEFTLELSELNLGSGKEDVIDSFELNELNLTNIKFKRI